MTLVAGSCNHETLNRGFGDSDRQFRSLEIVGNRKGKRFDLFDEYRPAVWLQGSGIGIAKLAWRKENLISKLLRERECGCEYECECSASAVCVCVCECDCGYGWKVWRCRVQSGQVRSGQTCWKKPCGKSQSPLLPLKLAKGEPCPQAPPRFPPS